MSQYKPGMVHPADDYRSYFSDAQIEGMRNTYQNKSEEDASQHQVGGSHYKKQKLQPLEAAYQRYGYEGVKASIHVKVDKYLTRDKGNESEDIDKAIHCLQLLRGFYDRDNGV